jgi:predicted DsbA family dithiol-disulfide isomerase
MARITITEFTDPGCPWAYSAEPARLRINWLYGEHIDWRLRMVVLSQAPEDFERIGFTPQRAARHHAGFAKRYGMPFELTPGPRVAVSKPACRAVVAARLHAPEHAWLLLRALRVRNFSGELFDEPVTIAAAARDAGIDPDELAAWIADPGTEAALEEDMWQARHPTAAALALDHKLAKWSGGRRYTCPSYEIAGAGVLTLSAPGFQPADVYETLIANVDPELPRHKPPRDVSELLAWSAAPPATAEVAEVLGIGIDAARSQLESAATFDAVGSDGFWRLEPVAATAGAANH